MIPIRGITVSVGYGPILEKTLVKNMRHMVECLVATSPDDEHSQAVARSVPGVRLHISDAATRHGAWFNKGLLMEEGISILGKHGWILIHDADIMFPDEMPLDNLKEDTLYGCRRRQLTNPDEWTPDLDWRRCPMMADGGPVGFYQLAHADAPNLRNRHPWYDVSFTHAGGCDAAFMDSFPTSKRKVLPIEVLHFGERDRNWFSTSPEGRKVMDAFVTRNGWNRARTGRRIDPKIVEEVGEFAERVEVPGYPKSTYELPFVRRAQVRKQMEEGRPQ